MDTRAFHSLSYGLYVVTAAGEDDKKCGCVVNTFQQVTSNPPQVSVAINKENATLGAVLSSGRFCVTVLEQDTPMEFIGTFGFHSSADTDKFSAAGHRVCGDGLVQLLEHGVALFSCTVVNTVDVGTHVVVFGAVDDAEVLSAADPLTYAYYHTVKRGKTPPKASSFIEESAAAAVVAEAEPTAVRVGWRCSVCGYIQEGYPDGLPADFRCPVCGVGPEMFERIEL